MRKSALALSVALALLSGQALADQKTYQALADAGVTMTAQQAAAIQKADAKHLAKEVAKLVKAHPQQAGVIVSAAIGAHPELAAEIAEEAFKAAGNNVSVQKAVRAAAMAAVAGTEYEQEVKDKVEEVTRIPENGDDNVTPSGVELPTTAIPGTGGGGGGDNTASPN